MHGVKLADGLHRNDIDLHASDLQDSDGATAHQAGAGNSVGHMQASVGLQSWPPRLVSVHIQPQRSWSPCLSVLPLEFFNPNGPSLMGSLSSDLTFAAGSCLAPLFLALQCKHDRHRAAAADT